MPLSIGQILTVSYNLAKEQMFRNGKRFDDCRLNGAVRTGAIRFMPLGAVVEVPTTSGSLFYSIQQLSVPLAWSAQDEADNQTENQRISLVRSLIVNGVNAHDSLLKEKLKGHKLIISREYFRDLGEVVTVPLDDGVGYMTKIYTAFAQIPR